MYISDDALQPRVCQENSLRYLLDCKTAASFAKSPKSEVFERVLTRGREMGERGEEGIARPGEKGNGERGHFLFSLAAQLLPRPVLPFHDCASKLTQKPRFSGFWRRKGLFCSLDICQILKQPQRQAGLWFFVSGRQRNIKGGGGRGLG